MMMLAEEVEPHSADASSPCLCSILFCARQAIKINARQRAQNNAPVEILSYSWSKHGKINYENK